MLLITLAALLALPHVLTTPTPVESATPAPPESQPSDLELEALINHMTFGMSLPEFEALRDAQDPKYVDWSSDGCTASPDKPLGFWFRPACQRHDFGYQNFRRINQWTAYNKARIDHNFKKDMYYQCSLGHARGFCQWIADIYHLVVSRFGRHDVNPEKKE